jgi:glutathione S-transferase
MLELFHAAPSYYSMVARLALAEAQLSYTSRLLDIHLARQQLSPAYRQLNGAMTVPTLRGPDLLLTDSADILAFAAAQAGARWADADPAVQSDIQAAVARHYAISIETLTFSKLLTNSPWTRPLVHSLLARLVRHLEQQADAEARGGQASAAAELRAKAEQNRQRLHRFIDAPPADTLAAMRSQVATYLKSLPPVATGGWLFAESISSADVVLAALCARLSMAGELALLQRADLGDWWNRHQQRPAFAAADIWTRFQRRRFLAAVLAARHTPIEP